ncbi:complement factor B-like [Trachinotus anak]|uniref:complement factor B-like n=1 Tax=Trachinotus anak TaxID=443729 RepID=UPI0039F17CFB
MGFSVPCSWFVALSLLCMGGEVWSDCTDEGIHIEGGSYLLTKQLQSGSMLIYKCPEGYYPYPTITRLCQLDGSWTQPKNSSPQKCKMVECPDPNVLEYGDVFPPERKYFVDNVTTYECYSGYTLRGSARRVCLPNGKWSGSSPICSRDLGDDCPDPGIPAGASRTGNMFGVGDKVKYSCNGNGLFLVGSSERVCQESGHWTGREPECYYKHTFDSPLDASESFGSAIKESLTTLEPTNDTQEARTLRISKRGTLNIYIGVDISESIDEENVTAAKNAIISLISKISSFTVSPNYDILFFSSEIIKVVNITDFLNAKVEEFTIIDALKNFKVGDQNTAGTNLKLVFESFLSQMSFIQERVGVEAFKEHHHAIILFTDGAYNMGGSPAPTVQKIRNLVYMKHITGDEPNPRKDFLDIYIFAIGEEIFDDDLQPLTEGVGGKHYFRLNKIENLQKTFDEMIDEEDVKGLCGLHKAYERDSFGNKREMYPWWAQIYVKSGQKTSKCLGSLVTPRFILTAAHCFSRDTVAADVQVEIDDGAGKVKVVKDIFPHQDYNISARVDQKVLEFYDYDVALILLETDVKISFQARPICLPCTVETRVALKLPADSTCAQQEQLLLKDHLEKLSFLTKDKNSIHEKDAYVKLGDTRAGCIKHALRAKTKIQTDNPEIAVTENFLCSGGRTIDYRSHIACKGDSGGAVFKDHEYRTIQIAVVSWGNKEMCSGGGLKESDDTSRDFFINLFRVVPFLKSYLEDHKFKGVAKLQFLE